MSKMFKKDFLYNVFSKKSIKFFIAVGLLILLGVVFLRSNDSKVKQDMTILPTSANIQLEEIKGTSYYVSPNGNDTNNGLSQEASLKSIQKAISLAQPGDGVILADGVYVQDIITVRNGTPTSPITIRGSSDAVIKGAGAPRIFEINHNYIHVEGFTIDGFWGSDANKAENYRDKLLYVLGKQPQDGVTGLKMLKMTLKNAGGECVRLRYFAHDNEIAYNTIGPCGVEDFKFESDNKNGEGVYVGTSSDQWGDGKNPTNEPDISTRNIIHHNIFNTEGNECVDIKEGSVKNIIENNSCTGQKDSNSGGFDARGDENIIRKNSIFNNLGAGVRLGGHTVDGKTYGKNNEVYNNTFRNNKAGGIKIEVEPQGKICGNDMSENNSAEVMGSESDIYEPTKACQ